MHKKLILFNNGTPNKNKIKILRPFHIKTMTDIVKNDQRRMESKFKG